MTIYVFVVDTSPGMAQPLEPAGLGGSPLTCLEIAKSGIEHFYKSLEQQKRIEEGDKFVLASYDTAGSSSCIKSNLKNDGAHFLHQVKHLRPRSTEFDAGKAFRAVFDHLNLFNAAHGYNTSGLGKFVGWSEMTFIFWLTTGERASSVPDPEGTALIIPPLTSPGANMFREPFRWDQRLFALLLHQDGTIPALMGQATNMAGDMSGDIFQISSARGMTWCIENIVGYRRYIHPGVAPQRCVLYESGMNVTWELIENPDAPTGKLLKAPIFFDKSRQHYAFFPIPEAYWCDLYTEGVPCVSSIPMITILAVDTTLSIPNGITPERFAIAHTEITDTLASKPPGTCWMVFVRGSDGSGGLGRPFGFLKMNSTGHTVHLNLLPYDPEKLFAVWVGCYRSAPIVPAQRWHQDFWSYLESVPVYVWSPVRTLLKRIDQARLFPEGAWKSQLGRPIQRQANQVKVEAGKLWAAVVPVESGDVMSVEQPSAASIRTRLVSDASMVSGADLFTKLEDMRRAIFQAFGLPIPMGPAKRGIVAADPSHDPPGLREVPIWKMGDYENYPKKPEFRDYRMDDDERKRWAKTAFGNPYRDISLEGNARGFMPESNEAVNEALTINYVPDGGEGLNDDAESVRSGSSRASWKTSSSGVPIRKERRRTYTPTKSFDASKLPAVTIEQKAALGLSPKVWARIFAPRSPSPSLSESTNSNAASTSASDNRKRKFAEFVVDIDEDDLYGPEKSDGATSPVDSGEPMPWQDERSAAAQPSAVDAALAEIEAADASKGFVEWRYEITKMFQQMGKTFDEARLVNAIRRSQAAKRLSDKERLRLLTHCIAMAESFRKPRIRTLLLEFDGK